MTKDEVEALRNSEEYKKYDKEFMHEDEINWGWESSYDLAIAKLIEKDNEIAKLQENIEFRCDLARFAGYDEAYHRYA